KASRPLRRPGAFAPSGARWPRGTSTPGRFPHPTPRRCSPADLRARHRRAPRSGLTRWGLPPHRGPRTKGPPQIQLGMVGLGRMGANLVRRLVRDGHTCVVYDVDAAVVTSLAAESDAITGASDLDDFVAKLEVP